MPIPLIAALIALFGVLVSLLTTLRTTNSFARAQLFLELRKRFSKVNGGLQVMGRDYHDETWQPIPGPDDQAKKDFKSLEAYWFHTFDEWYVTRKLLPSRFGVLWRTFFKRAIYEGMKNLPIRYTLFYMVTKPRTSFSGHAEDFVRDLEELYRDYAHAPKEFPHSKRSMFRDSKGNDFELSEKR